MVFWLIMYRVKTFIWCESITSLIVQSRLQGEIRWENKLQAGLACLPVSWIPISHRIVLRSREKGRRLWNPSQWREESSVKYRARAKRCGTPPREEHPVRLRRSAPRAEAHRSADIAYEKFRLATTVWKMKFERVSSRHLRSMSHGVKSSFDWNLSNENMPGKSLRFYRNGQQIRTCRSIE